MDLSFLLWLQGVRESSPAFVQAFFSFLGSEAAMAIAMVLPCIIYWCTDKVSGQFALLAYGASSAFNQLVKNTVCEYRPWLRDPRITPDPKALDGAEGFSFPSGHTQSSASLLGGIAWAKRREKPWAMVLAMAFTFLIAFSRLFLGVHAPQDVVVGFVEGCAFVLLADRLVPWLEKKDGRDMRALVVGCILTLAYLVFVTVKPYDLETVNGALPADPVEMIVSCYKAGGVFVGILAGWVVERRYVQFETEGIPFLEGALRLVVGSLIVLAVYVLLGHPLIALVGENVGQFVHHAAVFFMITAGAPALFEPLGRVYVRVAQR